MKQAKLYLIGCFFMIVLTSCNHDKTEFPINDLLIGTWHWNQCIKSQFDCSEQPSDKLKRSIFFSASKDDNLLFKTYKNDSTIKTGYVKLKQENTDSWIVDEDIVFGTDSIVFHGNEYYLNKINDSTIWIRLGTSKSSLVYEFIKRI